MKKYTRPQMVIEEFAANEYVAVCYALACNYVAANEVEKQKGTYSEHPEGNQVNHGADGCGTASHQYITEENGQVVIRELSSDQGWLNCTVTNGNTKDITSGTYVEWTTSASGGRVWHHQGTAAEIYPGHPNRS